MALYNSLSPSFAQKVVRQFDFPTDSAPFLESYNKTFPQTNEALKRVWDNGLQGFDSPESLNPPIELSSDFSPLSGGSQGSAWTFITAPEGISWTTSNAVSRVDVFGTNNPPVVSGARGMRDLTLSNALVEGFVRQKSIEGKVSALEKLMDYRLNPTDGFVSVPAYQLWANNKSYGGSNGYFVINSVSVQETMRDIQGNATRAFVDISLTQVPEYQVNSGRDLAGLTVAGEQAIAIQQANQGIGTTKAAGGPQAAPPK